MFGTPAKFEEVFPEIESIEIETYEEYDRLNRLGKHSYKMNQDNIIQQLICSNPNCNQNRGINIQPLISEMVKNKTMKASEFVKCSGFEKGIDNRHCMNGHTVNISIKYKETAN